MMVSHVAQLFDAQIRAGHIERGQNPVKGLVIFKKSDKKVARDDGHGWEPFAHAQLRLIFDPANLKRSRTAHLRWGALIGIYTGARVGEIAQLFLRDFEEIDGVKCLRITADSDGQSVKTESSRRLVPIG
jgi:integrase